ncbi:MAG: cysteine desulfurase [Phycisphaerales bacterium]|nr:cysteine desulfurase [Phycisphaerales bacterium]
MSVSTAIGPDQIAAIRADLPALARRVHDDVPAVYLDAAASTPRAKPVIEAVRAFDEQFPANVHRATHQMASEATEAFEAARADVARFISAAAPGEVVFTRGTTEAINLFANTWGASSLQAGDEVLITALEHHANIVPWQLLAQRTGCVLSVIDCEDDGSIDTERALSCFSDRTRLLSVTWISNALGTIVDIEPLIAHARSRGITTLVDAAQAVGHRPVDVRALGADAIAFSGHKMFGPTGIGCLWAHGELLDSLPPWQGGGEMIDTVSFDGSTWNTPPWRFEAGTPNISGAIGLGAAVRWLEHIGMDAVAAHDLAVTGDLARRLSGIDRVRLVGTPTHRSGAVSFVVDGIHPADCGMLLDRHGIAVRTGHHCAEPIMRRMGVSGTVRASTGCFTSVDDIDRIEQALTRVIEVFG